MNNATIIPAVILAAILRSAILAHTKPAHRDDTRPKPRRQIIIGSVKAKVISAAV
jgi:hypothetical protein